MSLIRTIQNKITIRSAALYQRALRTIGIADCTEMRVTSAVAVCVAMYYIIALCIWIVNILHDASTITALIIQ